MSGRRWPASYKERLRALVEGRNWAPMGTGAPSEPLQTEAQQDPGNDEVPGNPGPLDNGRGGFRTCDLSRVKHGFRGGTQATKYLQLRPNSRAVTCAALGLVRPNTAGFGPTNGPNG